MNPAIPDLDPPDMDETPEPAACEDDRVPKPAVYPVEFAAEFIDPDAIKVIRRLRRYGHHAYLVGGGVRDLLLGKKPKDFDVATSAKPHEVRRLFRNCRVIGRRFRLAHILFAGGKIIEVATFRRDPMQAFDIVEGEFAEEMQEVESSGASRLVPRHSERGDDADLLIRYDNVFGEPHEDAIRRDFTMNGLFYDLERCEVIDFVGGVPDVRRKVVRTIGDPDVRFREDPVRILRAIKFSARLDLGIDPEVYDAMVDHRGELAKAAPPRLLEEVLRLLRGGAAHRSIYLAWDTGVLAVVLPELASYLDDVGGEADQVWRRLAALDRRKEAGVLPSDAVLLSALLLDPAEEAIEGMPDAQTAFDDFVDDLGLRLSLPRRMKERMRLLVTAQRRLRAGRLGALPRRDFFAEATELFVIDAEARGDSLPGWASAHVESPEGHAEEPRRRRRRRPRRSL